MERMFLGLQGRWRVGNVHWETEGHLELAARGTTSVEKVLSVVAHTAIALQ
jgi:hypothetical protein